MSGGGGAGGGGRKGPLHVRARPLPQRDPRARAQGALPCAGGRRAPRLLWLPACSAQSRLLGACAKLVQSCHLACMHCSWSVASCIAFVHNLDAHASCAAVFVFVLQQEGTQCALAIPQGADQPSCCVQLRIPKFFLNNYADIRTTANATADTLFDMIHFPSIFFGPPGSSSPLHSDGARSSRACALLHCACACVCVRAWHMRELPGTRARGEVLARGALCCVRCRASV